MLNMYSQIQQVLEATARFDLEAEAAVGCAAGCPTQLS